MARKGKYKKVICPICWGLVRLNNKGVIKSHSRIGKHRYDRPQCRGTYKKPKLVN